MMFRRMFGLPNATVRWPLGELDRMRRQLDRLSETFRTTSPHHGSAPSGVFPSINLTEDAQSYHVRAELPGMKSDELDIQVVGKNLSIAGERKITNEGGSVKYHRRERESGQFSRMIGLPGDINTEKVAAKLSNGILTITVPKAESAKPRQINIR